MMGLREIIKEHLLIEKKIAQISSEMKIQFNFEVDRKKHAIDRATRPELGPDYNQREISNSELKEFVTLFIKEISEKIVRRSNCGRGRLLRDSRVVVARHRAR